jgi:integrase
LIFTSKNGSPIDPKNLLRDFKHVLQNAGLPKIRFHDLRHTSASIMLNHGTPVILVSRRLGHAKASITLHTYGHLIPSFQKEAAELMDMLIMPIELHTISQGKHRKLKALFKFPIYSQNSLSRGK